MGELTRSEWLQGQDVSMEFRSRRGSLIKVTVHASADPIDQDEAIAMAREAISRLTSEQPGPLFPNARTTKSKPIDAGELFRSWAVPEH